MRNDLRSTALIARPSGNRCCSRFSGRSVTGLGVLSRRRGRRPPWVKAVPRYYILPLSRHLTPLAIKLVVSFFRRERRHNLRSPQPRYETAEMVGRKRGAAAEPGLQIQRAGCDYGTLLVGSGIVGDDTILILIVRTPLGSCVRVPCAPFVGHVVEARAGTRGQQRHDRNERCEHPAGHAGWTASELEKFAEPRAARPFSDCSSKCRRMPTL